MRLNRKSIGGLALLLSAIPAWAGHTYMVEWNVTEPTAIGGTEVKPGDYEIKAEEGQSQLQLLSHGKMLAQVPCHWIQLPSKAIASGVGTESNKVTSVEFEGKTAAIGF